MSINVMREDIQCNVINVHCVGDDSFQVESTLWIPGLSPNTVSMHCCILCIPLVRSLLMCVIAVQGK